MINRIILCISACLLCIPSLAQNTKSVEGIRISQIDGHVQLDSLIAFRETYNEGGILINRRVLIEEPNTYYLDKSYDSASQLIREEKRSLEGSPIEIFEYSYEEGEMKSRKKIRPGGDTINQDVFQVLGVDSLLVKRVFSSIENGVKKKELTYFSYNQDDQISHSYHQKNKQTIYDEYYTYDDEGRLTEKLVSYKNPAFELKRTYKYKKNLLFQEKKFVNEKLVSTTTFNRNDANEITSAETSFPKKDGLQTTYYQRKFWPEVIEQEAEEVSRGEAQTAEKP